MFAFATGEYAFTCALTTHIGSKNRFHMVRDSALPHTHGVWVKVNVIDRNFLSLFTYYYVLPKTTFSLRF